MATVAGELRGVAGVERTFFFGLAAAMALATFVGFAPTYYLVSVLHGTTTRGVVDGAGLTMAVHLHGITGSVWMILLLAQTGLVAADRRDIHMKLGLAALPVGLAITVTALWVALDAAARGSVPPGWTPPQFLLIQFGTLGGFLLFAGLGLLIAMQPARVLLSGTEAWQSVGRALIP